MTFYPRSTKTIAAGRRCLGAAGSLRTLGAASAAPLGSTRALCAAAAAHAGAVEEPWRVCIVGSGPAGFYSAKYLLKALDSSSGGRGDGDQDEDSTPPPPQQQQQQQRGVLVDMVERLPTPFGLVRSGVAPDHQDVKTVQADFEEVAKDGRFSFLGNVEVGTDVSVAALRRLYDAVILCHGASEDRMLGLDGEEQLGNVLGAREFVNWYNGHPDFVHLAPDLVGAGGRGGGSSGSSNSSNSSSSSSSSSSSNGGGMTAVVVGNGNVAIDCARILTKSVDDLATNSDITAHALQALRGSRVDHVVLLGRRSHAQASFTIKELRELSRLDGVDTVVHRHELMQARDSPASMEELKAARARTRIDKLLGDICDALPEEEKTPAARAAAHAAGRKTIELRFLASPSALYPQGVSSSPSSPTSPTSSTAGRPAAAARMHAGPAVSGVQVTRMTLEGEAHAQRAVPVAGAEPETIPCGLVLRSIGYRSVALPGVPFDARRAVVANKGGRVVASSDGDSGDAQGAADDSHGSSSSSSSNSLTQLGSSGPLAKLYVSGWLKRGPSGIVGTNIVDAKETVAAVASDLVEESAATATGTTTATATAASSGGGGRTRGREGLLEFLLGSGARGAGGNTTKKTTSGKVEAEVESLQVVDWAGHRAIDTEEVSRGAAVGKPREKIITVQEMLSVAAAQASSSS
eukprot:g2933.t1